MPDYPKSEILISVLRSASSLLEHYGYSGHDPSLSELQGSLARAMAQLEAQVAADAAEPSVFEPKSPSRAEEPPAAWRPRKWKEPTLLR